MQKALEQLGFGPCYHMRTCMNEYPNDSVMWIEAFEAKYRGIGTFGRKEWDQLLGHYRVSSMTSRISQAIVYSFEYSPSVISQP